MLNPKLILYAPNGCHVYIGARKRDGYGSVTHKSGETLAHRVAWVVTHGPIPDGLCVMHLCDNRSCVNPVHLRLGTILDNQRDMARKGRGGHSRLTPEQVAYIRKSMAPSSKLASELGVGERAISRIRKGQRWKL